MMYRNWKDVPAANWRWKNFSPRELACKGTGELKIYEPALDRLQALREGLGTPIIITSAYRSPEHNAAVGGAKGSLHLQGMAFDCRMDNHDPLIFEAAAREAGFTGFGFYPKQGFMHIDVGPARVWGTPFPRAATNLAPEKPARQSVAQSSTVKAVVVDIAAKAGAAAAVIPALDGRVQMIAIALAGIGVLAALWILRERIKAWADGWQ